jgi:hypothetical protein
MQERFKRFGSKARPQGNPAIPSGLFYFMEEMEQHGYFQNIITKLMLRNVAALNNNAQNVYEV